MKKHIILIFTILLFNTISCTEDDMAFEGPLLDYPLIMGVRVDPPVAKGGEQLSFEAVAHWPEGTPNYLWILCLPEFDSGVFDDALTCVSNHLEVGDDLLPCVFDDNFKNPCSLGMGETTELLFPSNLLPPDSEYFAFIHLVVSSSPDVFAHCGDGLATGRPPVDCMGAVKYMQIVSDEQEVTNVNPVFMELSIDDVIIDASQVPTLQISTESLHRIVKITLDGSSIDEIVRTTETGDIYMNLDLKIYTDCGELLYYSEDTDKEEDIWRDFGDYRSEVRCTDFNDGMGTVCEESQVEWIVKEPGECKIIYVIRDNFGGLDWREQHVVFE
jgi:hypothetical protein